MLYLLFVGVLIVFIVGLGVLLGSMDIQNIQAEWAKRRCEPAVMFSGFLYKPSEDPRSATAFSADNFSFCVRSLIDDVFAELLAPIFGIFSQQMAAANTTNGVFNSVRNQIGNTFRSFGGVFNDFFETYKRGALQLSRITQLLKQAMLKVSGAMVSIVFLGLSLMTSLLNTYDFIVKVVIIIMSILVALIVLLFFALIPFMPIIFTTIAILTGAGLGSAVGGMAGAFCIDPDAEVLLVTGETVPLKKINIGDALGRDCGIVEGILETDTEGPLYNIGGVIISGSHMVEGPSGENIFAADHPSATPVATEKPKKLIILNTTTRKIPVIMPDTRTVLTVRDWEEFPEDDEEGHQLWEHLVWDILNPGVEKPAGPFNTEEALFSRHSEVYEKNLGVIPLSFVARGMDILDITGRYTKVLGRYKGVAYNQGSCGEQWHTTGVRRLNSNGRWEKRPVTTTATTTTQTTTQKTPPTTTTTAPTTVIGYHLITETGTFLISSKGKTLRVRDYTEVGWKRIDKTYETVRLYLNKKKETQQSSNTTVCVSDSSSQAWCSCWPQIFS